MRQIANKLAIGLGVLAACTMTAATAEVNWSSIRGKVEKELDQLNTDRIQLFAKCGDIGFQVYLSAGPENGVREALETAGRSRLRAARIYKPSPEPVNGVLMLSVNVIRGVAFSYRVWFEKPQVDKMAGFEFADWSPTGWTRGAIAGTTDTRAKFP